MNISNLFSPTSLLIDAGTTLFGNAQQNYYNRQLAEYQNEWNYKMWQEQNEYNSPTATMQRLTDAGINPRAYQQLGQFANAADAPQAAQYQKTAPLTAFSDIARSFLEMKQMAANIEKTEAETNKTNEETETFESLRNLRDSLQGLYKSQGDYYFSKSTAESMRDLEFREKHNVWRWRNAYKVDKKGNYVGDKGMYGFQDLYDRSILMDSIARSKKTMQEWKKNNRDYLLGVDSLTGNPYIDGTQFGLKMLHTAFQWLNDL